MHALQRFIAIATLALAATFACAQTATPVKQVAPSKQSAAAPASQLLDINIATEDQLKALPGMGAAYARRIIDGRPYTAKNQLVTRGVVPQAAYERIAGMIIAHRVAK